MYVLLSFAHVGVCIRSFINRKLTTPSKTQHAETPHALHKAEGRAEAVLEYLQHAYDNKVVELSATRAQLKADMQVCV